MERWRQELYHHGILGQRWGKRNGPPYPLGAGDHSVSEKKAGWRKSLDTPAGGLDAGKKKRYNSVNRKNRKREKKHVPKYNAETPVWRLSPGQERMNVKDVSDEDVNKGKQAVKKILIATGAVAVTAVAAYALYKHHDAFKSNNLQEMMRQASEAAMTEFEIKQAAHQLESEKKNKPVQGLVQSKSDSPVHAFNQTFPNAAAFSSKVFEVSNNTMKSALTGKLFDKEYWDALPKDQQNAVNAYTGAHQWMSYKGMNKLLRFGESAIPEQWRSTVKKLTEDCAKALEHSVLKEDAISYRGVPLTTVQKMLGGMDLMHLNAGTFNRTDIIGKKFTESAFYSSSALKTGAFSGVKITTIVPKGTKAMYVDPVSVFPGERELLIQRGTEFNIIDFAVSESGLLKELTVEVIKQP